MHNHRITAVREIYIVCLNHKGNDKSLFPVNKIDANDSEDPSSPHTDQMRIVDAGCVSVSMKGLTMLTAL